MSFVMSMFSRVVEGVLYARIWGTTWKRAKLDSHLVKWCLDSGCCKKNTHTLPPFATLLKRPTLVPVFTKQEKSKKITTSIKLTLAFVLQWTVTVMVHTGSRENNTAFAIWYCYFWFYVLFDMVWVATFLGGLGMLNDFFLYKLMVIVSLLHTIFDLGKVLLQMLYFFFNSKRNMYHRLNGLTCCLPSSLAPGASFMKGGDEGELGSNRRWSSDTGGDRRQSSGECHWGPGFVQATEQYLSAAGLWVGDLWLKQQTFTSHSSGGWEVQDQGAGRFSVWWKASSWLADGHFLAVSLCGEEGDLLSLPLFRRAWIPLLRPQPQDLF